MTVSVGFMVNLLGDGFVLASTNVHKLAVVDCVVVMRVERGGCDRDWNET